MQKSLPQLAGDKVVASKTLTIQFSAEAEPLRDKAEIA